MSREASGALSSSPILHQILGVTDSAIVSPMASWNAWFALSRKMHRLLLVGALIEVVPELVMDRREVLLGRIDAHLDAQVVGVVDVPRARVADHVAIGRLREERPLPERRRQRREAERRVEALARSSPCRRRDVLRRFRMSVSEKPGLAVPGATRSKTLLQSCAQMLPSRCAGNRPVGRHGVAVLLVQLHPHVGVQRHVERPHLLPQPIDFLRELVGRHVVLQPPHRAGVGEAELLRALVGQLDEARVVRRASAPRSCASPPTPRGAASRRATSPGSR